MKKGRKEDGRMEGKKTARKKGGNSNGRADKHVEKHSVDHFTITQISKQYQSHLKYTIPIWQLYQKAEK